MQRNSSLQHLRTFVDCSPLSRQIVGVEILPDQATTFVDALKDAEAAEAARHDAGGAGVEEDYT